MFDSNAQASSVFRLLLGAVLGIAVLLIILMTLNYFQQQNKELAIREFYSGFGLALQTPDGTVVKKENLGFDNFTISRYGLSKKFSIAKECIKFEASKVSGVIVNREYLTIKKGLFNVYFKCLPGNSDATPSEFQNCEIFCVVSVGKELS